MQLGSKPYDPLRQLGARSEADERIIRPLGNQLANWQSNGSQRPSWVVNSAPEAITFDQQGYIDEASAGTAASPAGANNSAFADSGSTSRRLYWRFPSVIYDFKFLLLTGLDANTYAKSDNRSTLSLNLHYITDVDLDLTDLTWNNAGDLTYVAWQSAFISILPSDALFNLMTVTPTTVMDVGIGIPGGFTGMSGIRVMWNNDTGLAANDEAKILAWPTVAVYV